MEILQTLYKEILGFLGVNGIINIISSGDYSAFSTLDGILTALRPMIPLLLVFEFGLGIAQKNPQTKVYRTNFIIYVFNRFISRYISLGVTGWMIATLQPYAPFNATLTWYWLFYGYVVWEFAHFIYHFLGHKVRLFWCLHATHHTPEDMNLSVAHAHFFLEAPYADAIRTSICILAGLDPKLLFFIMFIDGTYGTFIHVGENLFKDGTLGLQKVRFFGKYILTPSDHRVHHARNPLYMDTNFCNFINIWDRVFGTYQVERKDIPIEYGITRKIDSGNFMETYFGEVWELLKDMASAPSLKAFLLYPIMPPGWSPDGNHRTATVVRQEYLENKEALVGTRG